ncbi:MAG: alpha-glucan family phosphorylase [Phycisphaerales bacterium]|nr:MAG: alpha-glucan family phosphorylase [Phycisphaerales bacterium]
MLPYGQARVRSFRVIPALPVPLAPLLEIAHNLWWTWNPRAIDLFVRLDRELWNETHHNPVRMLGQIAQETLDRAAADNSYLHALSLVHASMTAHMERPTWHDTRASERPEIGDKSDRPFLAAYFSAEFGLTECLHVYSGGLGVLAGDHLKSASELGVPLVGVGLLYRNGYFHQYLNSDGWQQETYPEQDFPNQPVHRVIDPTTGQQFRVSVELPGRSVTIGVWRCNVGRTALFLLDTNFPENQRDDRDITRNLYGGDVEMRIKQEIVLGIGGVRALEKMGVEPTVYHMNEGHSAFLALERIRVFRQAHNVSFDEARTAAAAGHVFTTHTPVPAGIDRFAPEIMERYFRHMLHDIGLDLEGLLALGREHTEDRGEFFSMAVLALRTARDCNGVSRLHGAVSRRMWQRLWPGLPEQEVPISHVTNGVHARSWIKSDLIDLFDRYLDSAWQRDPANHDVWRGVRDIPDEELWRVRQRTREQLVTWARSKSREQMRIRGAGQEEADRVAARVDPTAFTIGFARRFATYKRGTLLLRNLERLRALLTNDDRPVQLLLAGKAHPADGPGKELIRDLVRFARAEGLEGRLVFLEDYDMDVARRLVQGCDVWLNTPVRGMEASGTSGMKAAMNGVIHVSILDGWWDEAYDPESGFAIGRGEQYDDRDEQDEVESRALFDLIEREILPEFYDRDSAGLPRKWITRMKRSIAGMAPRFNSNRMVMGYASAHYYPAHEAAMMMQRDALRNARDVSDRMHRLRDHWPGVAIESVRSDISAQVPIRTGVRVEASVRLGDLSPEDVLVQVYHGAVTSTGDLVDGLAEEMTHEGGGERGSGLHTFAGSFTAHQSGRCGFSVRVLPREARLPTPFVPGLITWDVESDPDAPSTRQVSDFVVEPARA